MFSVIPRLEVPYLNNIYAGNQLHSSPISRSTQGSTQKPTNKLLPRLNSFNSNFLFLNFSRCSSATLFRLTRIPTVKLIKRTRA